MTRLVPSPEQIAATDPDSSNWVGANAGSGKTHVLTQRVARLLLAGAEPQKILCLTYTKAAASEMQARLFRTLGRWTMAPAGDLARDLADLAGGEAPDPTADVLAGARRLFARALETPGGLKIQTIHAFCTAVLRRFPLEAGVSPRFEVADDRRAALLLAEVREEMALDAPEAFDCVARMLNEGHIDALAEAVLRRRASFMGSGEERIAAWFGRDGGLTAAEIAAAALNELDRHQLASLQECLHRHGGKTAASLAAAFADCLAETCGEPDHLAGTLADALLTKAGTLRTGLATKGVLSARPGADGEIADLGEWASRTRARIRAVDVIRRTRDLYTFAGALVGRDGAAKAARGLLDYDDLVERTRGLLTDGAMRDWVLWKLDRGIDHVLVDEAQDTAPAQWDVIDALAEEFLGGARAAPWSLFVVGDEKQSIYSFQGAEPQAFGRMRDRFGGRLCALGRELGRPGLLTSYRSAPAILDFVDAVFAGEAAEGLTVSGDLVHHLAFRSGQHGRVDLWPVIEHEEPAEDRPWFDPVDAVAPSNTRERLARTVADQIGALLGEGWLAARPDRAARRIGPKDILVLVRKRDRLADGIIRRLKETGVPVAGADRLALTKELAVKDLLALAKVACLPSDDLSLAALLRSPLCDVDEDELFGLAHRRNGTLWQAVQRSVRHAAVARFLSDMAAQADFLRPYEFLERALIRHDGRRRLLARLGADSEDAIDELLAQALAYEQAEAPSLTGFVAWVEAGEITVKREMESGGDQVRVMTVHGAKGLEAPVVILPDTIAGGRPGGNGPNLMSAVAGGNLPGLTLWAGRKDDDDPVSAAARAEADRREAGERKRLLYVALTRAEDWLILCGAGLKTRRKDGTSPRGPWYEMLEAGMARSADVLRLPSPTGDGEMLRVESGPPPRPAEEGAPPRAAEPVAEVPGWLGPAPREVRQARPSPSSLGPSGPHGGAGIGRALALRLGEAVHLLLERLPDRPAADRPRFAERLLADGFADLAPEQRQAAWIEAERVLAMPEAAAIFGPDSLAEVTAAIPGPGAARMVGRIDRLLVGCDEIVIVDFKTDRAAPEKPDDVPAGYLAQLGAYRAAVSAAFPGRCIATALLWTTRPGLMRLNRELTDAAFVTSLGRAAGEY